MHTSKGELSVSIFDIHRFLRLRLSGRLYGETVPTQRQLTNKLPLSFTYLFITYPKLMQGNWTPHPRIESSIIDAGGHGWGSCEVVVDELGVAKGQRTETYAGCKRRGTFSVVSFTASGAGYCLPIAILASMYEGLNEISCSSHPSRGGGHFHAHLLYAWLVKNFDAYELVVEAFYSSCMVNHFNSKRPENSLVLGGASLETLLDDDKLSRANFAYFISIRPSFVSYHCEDSLIIEHYCPDRFIRPFSFYQDVPAHLDLDSLPDPKTMLRYHPVLTRYRIGSQTYSPHASDSKRKGNDLFGTNMSKDEGKLGSKPKLNIVRTRKLLEPCVPPIEDDSSRVKISGIDVAIPATPIPIIPVQSITPLP
ncbi:hypothetical protein Cgig2_001303 [Carnegiea gigantea]|uniref:Uncharacterized protein n=1 Tax=Carnegiea gigantea TaxID=171969 RepID=A0A9Q1JTF6_9CARY|nr:hypothetical protein Cgig2_001303 [Carnegiea gigantea]